MDSDVLELYPKKPNKPKSLTLSTQLSSEYFTPQENTLKNRDLRVVLGQFTNNLADHEAGFYKQFLYRAKPEKRASRPRQNKFFTRKERKRLGVQKLPTRGWNYSDLEDLREMWMDYALAERPTTETMVRLDFIGCEMSVERSQVPSNVGIGGTVVLETRHSFQVVTERDELKVLLKKPSIFVIRLGDKKISLVGKYLTQRPVERCTKKSKMLLYSELF